VDTSLFPRVLRGPRFPTASSGRVPAHLPLSPNRNLNQARSLPCPPQITIKIKKPDLFCRLWSVFCLLSSALQEVGLSGPCFRVFCVVRGYSLRVCFGFRYSSFGFPPRSVVPWSMVPLVRCQLSGPDPVSVIRGPRSKRKAQSAKRQGPDTASAVPFRPPSSALCSLVRGR